MNYRNDKPSLVLREPHAELEPASCRDYCRNIRQYDYGVSFRERTGKNEKDVRGEDSSAGNRSRGNPAGIKVFRGKVKGINKKGGINNV